MGPQRSYDMTASPSVRFTKRKSEVIIVPSLQAVENTAPNARQWGDSLKTLCRWKGSIYKLVWRHMLLYYLFYVALTLIYEYALEKDGKKHFKAIVKYFSKSASTLNLMIMLGFFTSTTLQRLFTMQTTVPGTAKIISLFIMSLKTDLPEGEIIVEQYARWAVLSWVLSVRSVSKPLRDKLPDMKSIQIEFQKVLLRGNERLILERAETDGDSTPRPLVVIDWMLLLLKECLTYGRYNNKSCHHKNVELLLAFKKSCGNMIKFATRNVPHSLIQAVIIAVYYFGLVTMMARDLSPHQQSRNEDNYQSIDNDAIVQIIVSYIPVMPFMQFFIFFAWLTFGRMAVNPFGDDETDINLETLLNSHIEDYKRLKRIYKHKLEDLFPDLPQKKYNVEASSSSTDVPQTNDTFHNDVTSSTGIRPMPEIEIFPQTAECPLLGEVGESVSKKDDIDKDTAIVVIESSGDKSVDDKKKIPWWKISKHLSLP